MSLFRKSKKKDNLRKQSMADGEGISTAEEDAEEIE
jgi:hypothetical protein